MSTDHMLRPLVELLAHQLGMVKKWVEFERKDIEKYGAPLPSTPAMLNAYVREAAATTETLRDLLNALR